MVDTGNSRAYIGHFAEEGVFIAGFQNRRSGCMTCARRTSPGSSVKDCGQVSELDHH